MTADVPHRPGGSAGGRAAGGRGAPAGAGNPAFPIAELSVTDVAECLRGIHQIGGASSSAEECADRLARYFYDCFVTPSRQRACVLSRVFKAHPLGELPADLQAEARALASGAEVSAATRCLVLLGTAGREEAWRSRHTSVAHRAIPLPSPEAVQRLPMIAQLIRDLGFDVAEVIDPAPDLVVTLAEQTCNVFHVGQAVGSRYIPAQDDFVVPYGVRSVVGFGGVMPSGNLFAVILFASERISEKTADLFKILAVSVKAALVRFDWGPTFAGDGGAAGRTA